jgi:hypothetical protein
MFCLAAAAEAAPPVLAAVRAPGLEAGAAWADPDGWKEAPSVLLRGTGGAAAQSASVKARWNEEAVFFEFVCRDAAIVSPGERDGLDHFRLGDVVEVFLGRADADDYAEVHATPAGRKTWYFFQGYRRAAAAPDAVAKIVVRAGEIRDGWRAVLVIPWTVFGANGSAGRWEFLAGRYDYAVAGGAPVLSSFPVQQGKPDFHARDRYARLELRP